LLDQIIVAADQVQIGVKSVRQLLRDREIVGQHELAVSVVVKPAHSVECGILEVLRWIGGLGLIRAPSIKHVFGEGVNVDKPSGGWERVHQPSDVLRLYF